MAASRVLREETAQADYSPNSRMPVYNSNLEWESTTVASESERVGLCERSHVSDLRKRWLQNFIKGRVQDIVHETFTNVSSTLYTHDRRRVDAANFSLSAVSNKNVSRNESLMAHKASS